MPTLSSTALLAPGAWRIRPAESQLEILVAREGALSPLGHDLFVDVRRFEGRVVVAEGGRADVTVSIDAASVVPRCARRDEVELRDGLSPSDLRDVERNMHKDVLRVARHPKIDFRSSTVGAGATARNLSVAGTLVLAGRSAQAVVEIEQPVAGEPRFLVRHRLRQSDYGITPYRALLGALRVRDDVVVRGAIVLERAPD